MNHPTLKFHNNVEMPAIGAGTWQVPEGPVVEATVSAALEVGYRHIDTAAGYKNEEGVGKAVRASGIPRKEIFVTTKLWNEDQRKGREGCLKAFDASLSRLGIEYIDLYLIHWPVKGKYVEAWDAMQKIYSTGKVRAIGVSNFLVHHLQDVINMGGIVPMNNQVEMHPRLLQPELRKFHQQHKITQTAWSPLMQGKIDAIPELRAIGEAHHKSAAQVALRWNIQHGVATIPRSTKRHRLEENAALFDFELSKEEMSRIDALDQHKRVGADPDTFNF